MDKENVITWEDSNIHTTFSVETSSEVSITWKEISSRTGENLIRTFGNGGSDWKI